MEEVDRILIRSLRDIGCQVGDSLQNVSEFDVNTLFGCVSQCLQLITANKDLPTRLPPNISTRFKVCGELAQLCQSNGYRGDIGYQTFLSINENETRKLLNFLIEKVPREATVTIASSTLDPWDALDRILSNKITTQLTESTWISHDLVIDLCHIPVHHPAASFAHKSGFTPTKHTQVSCLHVPPVKGKNKLSTDSSSYVFTQVDFQNLADSLIYENQVSCWIEKQRESSFLIPGQLITHKFSKEICRQIYDGDTIGAKYEYINRIDTKKKLDDSLLTRSRFMHTNVNEQQSNGFDEIANTNKQKEEINKTIIETRVLQKDLNRLTEKLERTFQVTDSQLFKDAKTDECARRSYKMLVAFHSDCDTIYKIVEDIGVIIREIRELEDQIEVESQKNMTTNLETLIGEYKKIRDENTALKGEKR
ncbi:unnamed protein product [Rotaria magnacalcarata]|uniref:Coiled-coil domain-containing protein 22 homolog n=1 Tax=Rotaria magnacalcarata TaxID=392030 RepID=A0A8S2M4Q2_9BILA|nr:unnamed protein product [Rotaria magnacalcarata]